jgi:hypothetical protein
MPKWDARETHTERIKREIEISLAVLANGGFVCVGNRPEGGRGPAYWIEPNGIRILTDTFSVIKNLAQLRPSGDGLFPGYSQTWRPYRLSWIP